MIPNPRREAALKLLAATGLNRWNYEPPIVRVLWRMGIDAPPPHFASFAYGALVSGASFAAIWALFLWLITWHSQGTSLALSIGMAAFGGLLFGVAMAGYYSVTRRKYRLPEWSTLLPAGRDA